MSEETYHKLQRIARHHGYLQWINPLVKVPQESCPDVSDETTSMMEPSVPQDRPILQVQQP
jgi:hypothetical protein